MTSQAKNRVERTKVVLQGGGRLDNVAQILDVRLEADPLTFAALGSNRISVKGGVRAYVYCRNARGREIDGQGFYIPFSSRIATGSIPAEHADVRISDLHSDHDFDAVTGEFQHQITVDLVIEDPRARAESPSAHASAPSQGAPHSESSQGETRLSQVRTGPSPDPDLDVPVSTREPTPDEFRALYGAMNGDDAAPEPNTTDQPAETGAAELSEDSKAPLDDPAQPIPEDRRPPAKKEGPIVWGPFPPPIA